MGKNVETKTLETHKRLIQTYGERELKPRREPMHELVSTMLSHRTNHADEELAYSRMLERFPSWEAVRNAPTDELAEAISPSRYPGSKAPILKRPLQRLSGSAAQPILTFCKIYLRMKGSSG